MTDMTHMELLGEKFHIDFSKLDYNQKRFISNYKVEIYNLCCDYKVIANRNNRSISLTEAMIEIFGDENYKSTIIYYINLIIIKLVIDKYSIMRVNETDTIFYNLFHI